MNTNGLITLQELVKNESKLLAELYNSKSLCGYLGTGWGAECLPIGQGSHLLCCYPAGHYFLNESTVLVVQGLSGVGSNVK